MPDLPISPELVLVAPPEEAAALRHALRDEPSWAAVRPAAAFEPPPPSRRRSRARRRLGSRVLVRVSLAGLAVAGVVLVSRQLNTISSPVETAGGMLPRVETLSVTTTIPAAPAAPNRSHGVLAAKHVAVTAAVPGGGYVTPTGDRFRVSPDGKFVVGLTAFAGCARTVQVERMAILGRRFVYVGPIVVAGAAGTLAVDGRFHGARAVMHLEVSAGSCRTLTRTLTARLS